MRTLRIIFYALTRPFDMRHGITVLLAVMVALWMGQTARAQNVGSDYGTGALTSQRQPLRIVVQPMYQYFENDDQGITEWSVPIRATIPLRENLQLSLRGSFASATGDELETVSGLSDAQASLSYVRQVGEGSVIVSAGVNAPIGKQELTLDEFTTATLLSQNVFDFRVPGFGQGLGLATGATWAVPVGEDVVLGLGGSFRYQGGYTPLEGMASNYNPGNEVLVTGGLDYRLNRTSALSGDVSITLYGTDQVGDVDQFEAGNKLSATVQYRRDQGYNTLRVLARYEGREKSTLPAVGSGSAQELQLLPSEGVLRGSFQTRLSDSVDLELWAGGRMFGETDVFEQKVLAVVGLMPQWEASDGLTLAPRFAYTGGDITGLEGGLVVYWQQ